MGKEPLESMIFTPWRPLFLELSSSRVTCRTVLKVKQTVHVQNFSYLLVHVHASVPKHVHVHFLSVYVQLCKTDVSSIPDIIMYGTIVIEHTV